MAEGECINKLFSFVLFFSRWEMWDGPIEIETLVMREWETDDILQKVNMDALDGSSGRLKWTRICGGENVDGSLKLCCCHCRFQSSKRKQGKQKLGRWREVVV